MEHIPKRADVPGKIRLRVGTFNIYLWNKGSAKQLAQEIINAGADIVGLQEVGSQHAGCGHVEPAELEVS